MASVEQRSTRRAGRGAEVHDVRFRDPDARQRRKTFDEKGDADRCAASAAADTLRGQHVDHSDRTTVVEHARAWAATRPHRRSTAHRVASLVENHIAGPRPGDRRLSALRPSEVPS